MKFINPFGRSIGSGVQPQACMCDTGSASARGEEHWPSGCVHCGCGCGSNGAYHTANKQTTTIRCS